MATHGCHESPVSPKISTIVIELDFDIFSIQDFGVNKHRNLLSTWKAAAAGIIFDAI